MIKSTLYWSILILATIIIGHHHLWLVSSISIGDTHEWRRIVTHHDTYSSPHQYSRYHRFENDIDNEIEYIGSSSSSESNRRSPGNTTTTTAKGKFIYSFIFSPSHLWIITSGFVCVCRSF